MHGTYENKHFLEQRKRIVMKTTPTSTNNETTKVKRLREDRFCVFLFFFGLGFVLWWVTFIMLLSSLKSFLSPKI